MNAFYFDRAVWLFGSTMDQDLEEATSGSKSEKAAKRAKERRVSMWLNDSPGVYRDPRAEGKG